MLPGVCRQLGWERGKHRRHPGKRCHPRRHHDAPRAHRLPVIKSEAETPAIARQAGNLARIDDADSPLGKPRSVGDKEPQRDRCGNFTASKVAVGAECIGPPRVGQVAGLRI